MGPVPLMTSPQIKSAQQDSKNYFKIIWHWNVQEIENVKFLMVNLQDRAWHLQWMLINIESLTHQARWHVLIDFFITGGITCCCVIMALLHTSSWKPSSYTLSSLMPNKKNRKLHICYSGFTRHFATVVLKIQRDNNTLPLSCSSLKTLSPYIHHLKEKITV